MPLITWFLLRRRLAALLAHFLDGRVPSLWRSVELRDIPDVGGPVGGDVGTVVGGPVGGDVGTVGGGPVGGEVGRPVGTEIPTPAGLKRLQGEMNAPLTESQLVQGVGVLYHMQTTGKKDEHGTHFESGSGWSSTEQPGPPFCALSCIAVDEYVLIIIIKS